MRRGRPLLFLVMVLAGWTGTRVAMLRGGGEPGREDARGKVFERLSTTVTGASPVSGEGQRGATTPRVGEDRSRNPGPEPAALRVEGVSKIATLSSAAGGPPGARPARPDPRLRRRGLAGDDERAAATAPNAASLAPPTTGSGTDPRVVIAHAPPTPSDSAPLARLHGGTWLVGRPDTGDSLVFGQLGASQAGYRVTYAVDTPRRIALSIRLSTPLRGVGREAALGVDWRPTRLPVNLLVEQRIPLDGGAARPAAQVIAGTSARLPLGLRLDGYAQAGAVHRRGGFADGAAQLVRPLVTRRIGALDLGAGAWGAAQRRAARLDAGPTLGLTLPARGGSLRLAIDYRLRVAGRARPGSGPAVSLGTSF